MAKRRVSILKLMLNSFLTLSLSVESALRITYEIEPGIFDEKRGIAALLIKNSGFYFVRDPKF